MPHHYDQLSELRGPYQHIYLSPHLDDAALSCGGTIARYAAGYQPVLVVNICTRAPAAAGPFSAFAEENHQRWGLDPAEAVTRRLAEDLMALEILGADSCQLDLFDAIYRMPERYNSNATLFGALVDDDTLLASLVGPLADLAARFPEAIIYAPLGVGNHVDHQATYVAALALRASGATLAFYEDFPYVAAPGALDERLSQVGGGEMFLQSTIDIDAYLTRKVSAIEAYASQVGSLFGNATALAERVTAYAEGLRPDHGTYGERIWLRR
jgi:LmbE family N-acetylglucosaminyl deacetylase